MARSVGDKPAVDGSALDLSSRTLGIWAFIVSESLFLGALIVTYLTYRPINLLRPDAQDPKEFLQLGAAAAMTAILIGSSVTMALALAAIRRGALVRCRRYVLLSGMLGVCFLVGQAREFAGLIQQGVTFSSSLFGSTFFVLTGVHGAHVVIGTLWLGMVYWWIGRQAASGSPATTLSLDVELAGFYWHFVDLVWVVIFTLVYLW